MLTELVIIGLGAWRLALFFVDDVGPFGVMDRMRRLLRADGDYRREQLLQATDAGYEVPQERMLNNGWEKLWSCMRCMTAWTALGLYGLWQLDQRPVEVLAIWGLAQALDFVRNGGA
jgi:hypothetical protein